MGRTGTQERRFDTPGSRCGRRLALAAATVVLLWTVSGCGEMVYIRRAQQEQQDIRTVKVQLKAAAMALTAFRFDIGQLPTLEEGLSVLWLQPDEDELGMEKYRPNGYLEPLGEDPWGSECIYELGEPDENGAVTTYQLRSPGPNREDEQGEGDDIVWPEPVDEEGDL